MWSSPRLFSRRHAAGALALVLAMLVCTASAQATDSWSSGKALTSARFMLGATTAPDGTMYVLGGINGSGDVDTAETYSPSAGTWSTLPPMNYYRSSEGVAVGGDGRIYAIGGNGGDTSDPSGDTGALLDTVEAYDPSSGQWQIVHDPASDQPGTPALPTPRAGVAAVGDTGGGGNGDVYVFGGWDGVGDGFLADTLRYDPSSNTWTEMTPMPTPREYASAVLGSDGNIYVIGGVNDDGSLSTVEIYDPATDSWTAGPDLPTAEYGGSGAAVSNRIFVFGGYDGNEAISNNQELTVGGSSWTADTAMPRVRYLGAAAVSLSLKVWVFGGLGATGPLAASDVFTSIDTTPPVGSVSINGGAAATSSFTVSVLADATDTGSGVSAVRISSKSTLGSNGLLSLGVTQPYVDDTPITWDLTNTTYGGTMNQGTRWVYVQWEDGAGNWSTVRSDSIYVDTTTPVVTSGPTPKFLAGTQLNTGTLPVNVIWDGTDTGTVPPSFYLQSECNGGAWANVSFTPATAKTATKALPRGQSCEYQVAAHDLVNTSAYTVSRAFTGSVVQEDGTGVTRTGTWYYAAASTLDGGHERYATKAGASTSIKFTGTAIAWVAPTGPGKGSAKVYLDGVYQKTVSLYTTGFGYRKLMYTKMWPTAGTHTLKIVVVGTAGHPRVDIDAFTILS